MYITAFDVSKTGPVPWLPVQISLLSLTVGAVFATAGVAFKRVRTISMIGLVVLCFSIGWTITTTIPTWVERQKLISALRSHRCRLLNGLVTDFHPMPYQGHSNETFVLDGNRFEYSDYRVQPGFHQTASHGGPIEAGMRVRICAQGNDIAFLQFAR